MKDLYQILELPPTASEREIRSAYRKLARLHHPDVSQSPEAGVRFAEISEAYHILINPETRRQYDRGEYRPTRAARAAATVETAQARAERMDQYRSRINRVVDEMIEEERREIRKRSEAVSVVVTLFASTFLVAFARPSARVEPFGWVGQSIIFALACLGVWYLVIHLKNIFRNYTYRPAYLLSILKLTDEPTQPFTQATACTFLVGGYTLALLVGNAFGAVAFVTPGEQVTALDVLRSGFLYPPIAVLIVDYLRRINTFLEEL
ncbi:MAG: J domain-containing protein [Blastocatellia bacterium]|nr:J domain-containing protein [Blastocatellia bacterium]